jgi:hypothetical protein
MPAINKDDEFYLDYYANSNVEMQVDVDPSAALKEEPEPKKPEPVSRDEPA